MNQKVTAKLREWRDHPLIFVKEAIGVTPSAQQADALVKYNKTKRMTIRSGHGTGKDALASWLIIHFLSTRPFPKVVCTAPTAHQLADVLWSEISKWLRKSVLSEEFIIQKDKIFHKEHQKEWWAVGRTASVRASAEDQAETIAGFHGDHLLIVVDEASGVPDPVYIPLEGAMTQEDNRVLLIGNMTKNTGYFYDSHFHPKISQSWTKLHWDSRNSTNVTDDMVSYFREKYGEDSNIFRIRVAGDPPDESDNTLIPLSWALSCVDAAEDPGEQPLYLGVDVARYGEDKTIILPRRGINIYAWDEFQGMNTTEVGGATLRMFHELEASGIAVDSIGIGAGVADWLKSRPGGIGVVAEVNVAESSSDQKKYFRLRDELWWKLRERIQRGGMRFPCATAKEREMSNDLCNELAAPTYTFSGNGAIKVESKRELKNRGIPSPNIADALCLTEHFYMTAEAYWGKHNSGNQKFKKKDGSEKTHLSWMAA